jgi:hypothetical protein
MVSSTASKTVGSCVHDDVRDARISRTNIVLQPTCQRVRVRQRCRRASPDRDEDDETGVRSQEAEIFRTPAGARTYQLGNLAERLRVGLAAGSDGERALERLDGMVEDRDVVRFTHERVREGDGEHAVAEVAVALWFDVNDDVAPWQRVLNSARNSMC